MEPLTLAQREGRWLRWVYYELKPLLPRRLRLALRRKLAKYRRADAVGTWPIDKTAGNPPRGWSGWPDRKQFALVLTHDVEDRPGLANCQALANLELALGVRSSFNFVPEGRYTVPAALRRQLAGHGFEVGVHDLKHDGKLYHSRARFRRHAQKINHYLKEWEATGFRSGFMLHQLEWLHDLNLLYDCSTFDTDPFEPQPDGVRTIFPFWVGNGSDRGYVELPYTLVQDVTLFVVLQERTTTLWKEKLDWVAERGGMALLNTHPDYMAFAPQQPNSHTYPADYYRGFLEYVIDRYRGQYWHPLPRELASLMARMKPTTF
jgi:peptidoglycan/xylan/chitin deacetylase (PgdA/CDA1 family)